MRYMRRPLVEGDRVKLSEDGAPHVVTRVTLASATVVPRGKRVTVTVPLKVKGRPVYEEDGTQRTRSFEAYEGGATLNISPNAFVFQADKED